MFPTNRIQEAAAGRGPLKQPVFDDELNATLTKEINKRAERLQDKDIDLALRAKEAREFLDYHCHHVKQSWLDWIEESTRVMESIRQTRVAIGIESKLLLSECGDVRKFFLSETHEQEIAKLREFVELAERLRALKTDGTLDRLADTILKL